MTQDSQTSILELLEKACILVTLAFLLTRTRFFPNLLRPLLSVRERVLAALLLLAVGFAEVFISWQLHPGLSVDSPMNLRIVVVCAAGLLAGPWVGLFIGIAVTKLAMIHGPHPLEPIAISMVLAGVLGGIIQRWKPDLASRPLTGVALGACVSLLRNGLVWIFDHTNRQNVTVMAESLLLHGASVGLVLLVIEQSRKQEALTRAAAMAEVRELQARMNPHFLFNSLNTLSALSELDASSVPKAAQQLGKFLRASLDQHEQPYVSLREEMEVVDAYLEIESMRLGDRLRVERDIDPLLLNAQIPPFLLQPLVENAIQHGVQPNANRCYMLIGASRLEDQILLRVVDFGIGIARDPMREEAGHAHALCLLRRRLEGLYGPHFFIAVESRPGLGSEARVRIPYSPCEDTRFNQPIPDEPVAQPRLKVLQ